MFKQITLENFRTHKSTTIELYPVTLLIGNNNSGKTNLIAGIQHFANLVRRSYFNDNYKTVIVEKDFYPYRYRLAEENEPISLTISWANNEGKITYKIAIFKNSKFQGGASCQEEITLKLFNSYIPLTINNGYIKETDILYLRTKIQLNEALEQEERRLCNSFFEEFSNTFTYHFQPAFLKKRAIQKKTIPLIKDIEQEEELQIPANLGEAGDKLQNIIHYVQENKQRIFSLFVAKMRTIDPSFQGVRYDEKSSSLIWQFDLQRKGYIEEFKPDVVSDGFMKIAAISLLASLQKPPALIMLEEIENGINPGNIQQLMNWIWQAASFSQESPNSTQFILTSHSPSVLREFNQHPDHVYTVRLDKRSRQSDVRNLNTALDTLVGIGAINDDEVEYETEEHTGKKLIKIPKYQLAELWYSGTIG